MQICEKCHKALVCPNDNEDLVEKHRRDGTGSFWGCPNFPSCNYIHSDSKAKRQFELPPKPEPPVVNQPFHTVEDMYDLVESNNRMLKLISEHLGLTAH